MKTRLVFLIAGLALSACGGQAENATNAVVTNAADNSVNMTAIPEDGDAVALDNGDANIMAGMGTQVQDSWVGRWKGPEGLFLDIKPGGTPGTYALTLKDNLDSQASYAGTAEGVTIRFTRAGKPETIRRGTGAETGFKWLADKTNCLVIVAGKEGYCR